MEYENHRLDSVESRFLPTCDVGVEDVRPGAFILVVFGSTGDLSRRMLLPTLFSLYQSDKFAEGSCVLAVGRRGLSAEQYRGSVRESLERFGPEGLDESEREGFCKRVDYLQMDLQADESYKRLCERIGELSGDRQDVSVVYYLAVPPALVHPIIERLFGRGLCRNARNPKIIIEKPFGNDRASAAVLNEFILKHFDERQVYRIDHYLGKETVQNILFFRFANSIFEPMWNRRYVDHVQITVAESIGIENRGAFYDPAGVVRDIVQNHIMQLLALVAMEPPTGFEADLVRDEKVKVFRAIRPMNDDYIDKFMVRGQYGGGVVGGEQAVAYRDEKDVPADSNTATFFAGKFFIDNWRWAGVPFYVRAGKRLTKRVTEICVQFKQPPLRLLGRTCDIIKPNRLVLSIQPEEAMSLQLNVKKPGVGNEPFAINMDFDYVESFETKTRPAYERLLLDCLKGDLTLFARADGVEAMWEIVDPIIRRWDSMPAEDFPDYEGGSDGPKESAELLKRDGRRWREIQ